MKFIRNRFKNGRAEQKCICNGYCFLVLLNGIIVESIFKGMNIYIKKNFRFEDILFSVFNLRVTVYCFDKVEFNRKLIFVLLLFVFSAVHGQSNTKKLALVIGNSAYQYGGKLKNPVNDANLMASTLGNLGFEVIKETDATLIDMRNAFEQFANKIRQYNVVLFFFAGHGMQIDGENYLIPIDA